MGSRGSRWRGRMAAGAGRNGRRQGTWLGGATDGGGGGGQRGGAAGARALLGATRGRGFSRNGDGVQLLDSVGSYGQGAARFGGGGARAAGERWGRVAGMLGERVGGGVRDEQRQKRQSRASVAAPTLGTAEPWAWPRPCREVEEEVRCRRGVRGGGRSWPPWPLRRPETAAARSRVPAEASRAWSLPLPR